MTREINSVGLVCFANYCRSPVAKVLLENKYNDSLKVDSAGINPMITAGMDLRSVEYLRDNNMVFGIHTPKKIDKNFLTSFDIVFAMDTFILMQLNKTYKSYRSRFKLFTYQHRNLEIKDPYRFSKEEYKNVMNDIKFVIDQCKFKEKE